MDAVCRLVDGVLRTIVEKRGHKSDNIAWPFHTIAANFAVFIMSSVDD
jgi:hypothetical protein